jgi:hypothetical protein
MFIFTPAGLIDVGRLGADLFEEVRVQGVDPAFFPGKTKVLGSAGSLS